MRLTLKERKVVTKAMAEQYRRATKKAKGELLDRFVLATDYNRVYAARVLHGHGKRVATVPGLVLEGQARPGRKGPPRKPIYGPEVAKALKKV